MNQLLGLLDSLEASLLEGKRIPLTRMTIIQEKELLSKIKDDFMNRLSAFNFYFSYN